ncbi:TXD15-like protein [Mya arenaria]|uniref:TXD15-like protein n=1 Tax=Mya arenaria TaxID=6604 RepID=A0ABY7DFN8_MYAAR|nr:thioredoxin domain-containing protein 15-like [Mya arenaria]WAQ95723.1 TXD15-like protein [Mya arenaria]
MVAKVIEMRKPKLLFLSLCIYAVFSTLECHQLDTDNTTEKISAEKIDIQHNVEKDVHSDTTYDSELKVVAADTRYDSEVKVVADEPETKPGAKAGVVNENEEPVKDGSNQIVDQDVHIQSDIARDGYETTEGDKTDSLAETDKVDLSTEADIQQLISDKADISLNVNESNASASSNAEDIPANTTSESNSTIVQWLKYLFDPIFDEFREGVSSNKSNSSSENEISSNYSQGNESVTVNLNVSQSAEIVNTTEESSTNTTDNAKKVKFQCTGRNVTDNTNATVNLITTAQLLQLLNFEKNSTEENVTDCLLVMFYAPWCHFCAKTAPHYNALARAFPQLDFVAVDTAQFSNLLARFGTVSVPNILVFHQSRAAVKFNQTERTLENFITFVTNTTGLEANATVNITEADHMGPVPSTPTNEPDNLLLISWMFVIVCSSYMFIKSHKGQQWINRVCILWQEHQHID